ncbi:MAG: thiaminase II [Neisseriaceae bacterium]|nr:thiaminase II [Neisseriaceae bacterium]MBP6862064.1 thiaminase II [Neisseriaceae bacterium]
MTEKFSQRIFNKVQPLWDAYLSHPFVKGIGEGTLDHEKFKHYLEQDYVYLIEYSKLFSLGATQANDLDTKTLFANLLHGTLNFEMDLHRQYAAQFGISAEKLAATQPAATTVAYTSYMLNKAQSGLPYTLAAVLCCAWSYNYIGLALAKWEGALEHEFYGQWVKTYSSAEFTALANQCIDLIDHIAGDMPAVVQAELEEIIVYTSYFEHMFWDMGETLAMWPIKTLDHH